MGGRDVILYPAIDILDGRAVRLTQGDFNRATQYAQPIDAAREWAAAGAERLHVVDLDGARAGEPANLEHVARIAAETGLEIQLGGGLRSLASIDAAFAAGAARLVLGTAAFNDEALLAEAVARHGERIVVSVDVRGGRVATAGWTQTATLTALDAIERLAQRGVRRFVHTDVDRDGMLEGVDAAAVAVVADAVPGELLYSGGIGTTADLEALAALRHPRLAGVIVGKALYERRFTLAQAREALCTSSA
jgi:phosphoribosylformimino-5-aminoimidazole carboxamide ribotide isomerase